MARPRFFTARPELQAAILDAAVHEFATNGYEGASLNQVLAAAKLSKGAFYYYFDDKADLAATVLRKAYDEIVVSTGGVTVARDAEDFWAALAQMQRQSIETVERSRDTGEAVARIAVAAQRDPQLAALVAPVFQEATAAAVLSWKRGQAMGAVRTDVDTQLLVALAGAVKETVMRLCIPTRHPVPAKDVEAAAALVLDMTRRLCEPPKEAKKPVGKRRRKK